MDVTIGVVILHTSIASAQCAALTRVMSAASLQASFLGNHPSPYRMQQTLAPSASSLSPSHSASRRLLEFDIGPLAAGRSQWDHIQRRAPSASFRGEGILRGVLLRAEGRIWAGEIEKYISNISKIMTNITKI